MVLKTGLKVDKKLPKVCSNLPRVYILPTVTNLTLTGYEKSYLCIFVFKILNNTATQVKVILISCYKVAECLNFHCFYDKGTSQSMTMT